MSNWTLIQAIFHLATVATLATLWMRSRRPPQDDPRLSRGLQLLQTKITVLEDLSDRTDNQVKQLTALLDQKNRLLQNKILEAEQQILKIDHSMNKSMEVAEIFQDKIPYQEIAERQRTVEYVKVARMANSGLTVDEIAKSVHLPREQVELIAKFNREQLMFDEESLPEWATKPSDAKMDSLSDQMHANMHSISDMDFIGRLDSEPVRDLSGMARIDSEFKSAVKTAKEYDAQAQATLLDNKVADTLRSSMASGMQSMQPAVMSMRATAQTLKDKLVSTAEDLLRAQASSDHSNNSRSSSNYHQSNSNHYNNNSTNNYGTNSNTANSVGANNGSANNGALSGGAKQPGEIKRVVFPRIEK